MKEYIVERCVIERVSLRAENDRQAHLMARIPDSTELQVISRTVLAGEWVEESKDVSGV